MAGLPKGITKRADGRYCIRVMRDGQKVTRYAKTRKEAETILREITYELEHGTFVKQDKKTVNEWFDEWIKTYKEPTTKDSTLVTYKSSYNSQIRNAIGKMKLQSVRASHIQKILNGMQEQEYSKTHMHLVYVVIDCLLNQAVKEGLILNNPCKGVTVPTGKPKEDHIAMTVTQQKLFTGRLDDESQVLNSFVMLQLCTGMRYGETAALQWRDIDLKNKVLHIRHTVHVVDGADVLTTPKTKCSIRDIPLIPQAIEVLRRERQRTGQKVIAFDGFVFDNAGRAFAARTVNNYIKRICGEIGSDFPVLTSHCMRHTFATRAIENGMPPQTLKVILGHSSLAMTMDLYSHVLEDQKTADMERIASAF